MENTWDILSRESKGVLNDRFVMKYDRYINWQLLSANYDFSIELLRQYMHRVNWGLILKRQTFPLNFLREAVPYFTEDDWPIVCKYQRLSEPFVHEFSDKVFWPYVLIYQNVSGSFLNDHRQFLCDSNKGEEGVEI